MQRKLEAPWTFSHAAFKTPATNAAHQQMWALSSLMWQLLFLGSGTAFSRAVKGLEVNKALLAACGSSHFDDSQ